MARHRIGGCSIPNTADLLRRAMNTLERASQFRYALDPRQKIAAESPCQRGFPITTEEMGLHRRRSEPLGEWITEQPI